MPRADRARTGALAAGLAATLLTGCAGPVADWIVEAPNQRGIAMDAETVDDMRGQLQGKSSELATPAGMLRYLRAPPRPYDVTMRTWVVGETRGGGLETVTTWIFRPADERQPVAEPRGTVVLLHGFMLVKEIMGAFAAVLADAGFDTVLVDLPGHGESGGDFVTWGVREAPAVNALRRQLETEGAARPLIAFGVSLGGSVAIRAAAEEPGWDAVIALQPFEDPARVIPNYRSMAPAWLRFYASERRIEKAMNIAEMRGGFAFANARLAPLLADYTVPTLIEHGRLDALVPVAESEALAAAAPEAIDLIVSDANHFTLPLFLWERCPTIFSWLDERFSVARPQAVCDRITYQDPDGLLERSGLAEAN